MKKQIDLLSEYGNCLPGEDRLFGGNEFYIDMIPTTSHYRSLRLMMPLSQWQRLRLYVLKRVDSQCEFCGSSSNLEAHERWHFNEANKTQKPLRLMCLCKSCHLGVHIGVTREIGYYDEIKRHVLSITGWTENEFDAHDDKAREENRRLSEIKWKIDISLISNVGIPIYDKKRIKENIEKKKDKIRRAESKYSIDGLDLKREIAEGCVAFCNAKQNREITLDSISVDLEGRDIYGIKRMKSEETHFLTMPLKEFIEAYNNTVIVGDEHQLFEELKIIQPKRLIISEAAEYFPIDDDLIESAFQNSILIS